MEKKILIDASQEEETRVAILSEGNKLEEYDFEIAKNEEIKGNIYLAKVVKIESSLQAAFVDYGGKRQGFLPFNEISINCFNLPKEKIEDIKQEQFLYKDQLKNKSKNNNSTNSVEKNHSLEEDSLNDIDYSKEKFLKQLENENSEYGLRFGYKIENVLKVDQLIIVQVVKEERGNKGAALTTYLSIPGRYCVLMPNSTSDGGISKKITNIADRQRLKSILDRLDISENTNLIIRTASIDKSDNDIIQDYNYIHTIWNIILKQVKTMKKPGILFQEDILIKRIIRDLYSGNINEIIIDGNKAYKTAVSFAKLIAPDIIKKISKFRHDSLSLFKYYNLEEEIKNIYSPVVFLESGAYIVINITEALVAIDVNSGKSKGKRNVESMAFQTNLDVATEIAKQIKLRDLGGLIVIDFIDMENPKNRILVEKKMRDLIKEDIAKIQMGQISQFGLLEISRQRIKSSLVERTFKVCSKCQGVGYVRPLQLNALEILRNLYSDAENNRIRVKAEALVIAMPTLESFYILNNKRNHITELEKYLQASIRIECDDSISYPFYSIKEDNESKEEEQVSLLDLEIENTLNKIKNKKYKDKSKVVISKNKEDAPKKEKGLIRKLLGL